MTYHENSRQSLLFCPIRTPCLTFHEDSSSVPDTRGEENRRTGSRAAATNQGHTVISASAEIGTQTALPSSFVTVMGH